MIIKTFVRILPMSGNPPITLSRSSQIYDTCMIIVLNTYDIMPDSFLHCMTVNDLHNAGAITDSAIQGSGSPSKHR